MSHPNPHPEPAGAGLGPLLAVLSSLAGALFAPVDPGPALPGLGERMKRTAAAAVALLALFTACLLTLGVAAGYALGRAL